MFVFLNDAAFMQVLLHNAIFARSTDPDLSMGNRYGKSTYKQGQGFKVKNIDDDRRVINTGYIHINSGHYHLPYKISSVEVANDRVTQVRLL